MGNYTVTIHDDAGPNITIVIKGDGAPRYLDIPRGAWWTVIKAMTAHKEAWQWRTE